MTAITASIAMMTTITTTEAAITMSIATTTSMPMTTTTGITTSTATLAAALRDGDVAGLVLGEGVEVHAFGLGERLGEGPVALQGLLAGLGDELVLEGGDDVREARDVHREAVARGELHHAVAGAHARVAVEVQRLDDRRHAQHPGLVHRDDLGERLVAGLRELQGGLVEGAGVPQHALQHRVVAHVAPRGPRHVNV